MALLKKIKVTAGIALLGFTIGAQAGEAALEEFRSVEDMLAK